LSSGGYDERMEADGSLWEGQHPTKTRTECVVRTQKEKENAIGLNVKPGGPPGVRRGEKSFAIVSIPGVKQK